MVDWTKGIVKNKPIRPKIAALVERSESEAAGLEWGQTRLEQPNCPISKLVGFVDFCLDHRRVAKKSQFFPY